MFGFQFLAVLGLLMLLLNPSVGAPSPKRPPAVTTTMDTTPFGSPTTSPFGLSSLVTNLRGGEVVVAETLEDAEAIILKAGSEGKLVIIDFTATWCGPCKMIAPVFKELSDKISDAVFMKVDVDENPDTAAKYSVSAMPTFLFIKLGEVVDRLMGANPARLQELVKEHI